MSVSASERKKQLVDQILRLRAAEALAPEVDEIRSVRDDLERELGPTLSRGMTARLVGVSQTALDRWVAGGVIPTVITPRGKKAVPARGALDLVEAVRKRGDDTRHPLAAVAHADVEHLDDVERIARRALAPLSGVPVDGHRRAELRSLALHAVVADRLSPQVVRHAQRRLQRLQRDGRINPAYAERWERALASPLPQLRRTLTQDTQDGRDLRQNTPFAGVLAESERRRILSLVP